MIVETLKTYYSNKQVKKFKYTSDIKNINKFFNHTIAAAKFFAKTRCGNVDIQVDDKSLYINYLDVPNCNVIDVIIKVKSNDRN